MKCCRIWQPHHGEGTRELSRRRELHCEGRAGAVWLAGAGEAGRDERHATGAPPSEHHVGIGFSNCLIDF